MAIEEKDYSPAIMYGAQKNIKIDLGDLLDANENEILEFDTVDSAVNYIRVANAVTTIGPSFSSQGDDTNIDINMNTKGTGNFEIAHGTAQGATFVGVASSVNGFQFTPSATGGFLLLDVGGAGADANVNIRIEPNGTGLTELYSDEAGATGVVLQGKHESASPAADDVVFRMTGLGEDSAGNTQEYGSVDIIIDSPTTTSEAGGVVIRVAQGDGTLAEVGAFVHDGTLAVLELGDGATGGGLLISAISITPNDDNGAASTIPAGATAVAVAAVTNDVNDWIVLPALSDVEIGHTIKIACNAGGAFEMRTPTTSGERINTVDSDGTQEYACTDTEVISITKVSDADGWVATAQTALGAIATAVVPD